MVDHFIGIGGIGMSALAHISRQKGILVTGSDLSSSYVTEGLKKAGVEIFAQQREENITEAMRVIYSTDIPQDNPEYKRALSLQLPLLHRSVLLKELMQDKQPLLVAGTHGKTTTASLLAHALMHAGLKPSYAVGGIVKSLGLNGGYGEGPFFVAEACESDGSFLHYPGFGGILTSVDNDHLEFWKTEEALKKGFEQFYLAIQSKDHFFWCIDDPSLASFIREGVSYGFSPHADLQIKRSIQSGWKHVFDLSFEGKEYPEVEIPLIGAHNVLNATAVFGLMLRLGVPEESIRTAFSLFQGTKRRSEKKGEIDQISFYDDYAHHPTEIVATLKAMREAIRKEQRLVVAFQPHRYTRTKACLEQFQEVFHPADEVIITDIYSAGERPIDGIDISIFLEKISRKCHYVPRAELALYLFKFLRPKDVFVTMGAGDITQIGPEICRLKNASPS